MEPNQPEPAQNDSFRWEYIEKTKTGILIAVPVALLLALAIPHLHRGYWEDEIFSIIASRSLRGLFILFRDLENNMSLFQVILYFWMRLFGESEVATHALSLLTAVLTIPVFFRLERVWLNKTGSFFGVMLLATSPLFLNQSVETRSYAMLILSVTISTLLFVRLMGKPGYGLAIGYGLSVGCGVYLHYFGILIPLVHAFTFTRRTFTKKYLPLLLLSGLVAAMLISPLLLFPPKNKTQVDWIFAPGLNTLWYVLSACFGGGFVFVILAGCMVVVLKTGVWKSGASKELQAEKVSAAWAFAPVLLMWIFSIYVKPVFVIRFFTWVTPGVALFITLLLGFTGRSRLLKTGVGLLILGIFIVKTGALFRLKGDGYRGAVQYLNDRVKPGETVICYPYFWNLDVNFYLDKMGSRLPAARPVPVAAAPYLEGGGGVDPAPDLKLVERLAKNGGRVFLFTDGNPGFSKSDSLQQRLWRPEIRRILAREHPVVHEMMFESETQSPVRLEIYE